MCKRCHSVQKEIKKTWSWSYRSLHSKVTNIDIKSRLLVRRPGQAKNFSLSPRVSMLQNTHLCFHMFHALKSSWSQCNINSEAVGSSHGVCLMQHWGGSSSCSAQFCASCTCTETQTGWWWWPRTRPLRWWRTCLWIYLSWGQCTQWDFLDSSGSLFGMESLLGHWNSSFLLYPHQSKTH